MNVEQLIERLREFPGYYEVAVEVIVGGDIGTDAVDLEDVKVDGHAAAYVCLVPAPDEYDVRAFIDEGLAARERSLRCLVDPDGEDHYDHDLREAVAQAIRRFPNTDAPQWIGPESVLARVEEHLGIGPADD